MRRMFAALAAASLLLACAGCGARARQDDVSVSRSVPASSVSVSDPASGPETVWRYEVRLETYTDQRKAADGTLICSVSYEYPVLFLKDDRGAPYSGEGTPPPAEQLAVCRAFNDRWREDEFSASLASLTEVAEGFYKDCRTYGWEFRPCGDEQRVDSVYWTQRLLSVELGLYSYTGGAHGNAGVQAVNFDLERGEFFDWPELTDDENALRARLGGEVASAILREDMAGMLFEGYEKDARALSWAVCSFDERGVNLTFPESVLGSHAAGLPRFRVDYERFADLLNGRGTRLLARAAD